MFKPTLKRSKLHLHSTSTKTEESFKIPSKHQVDNYLPEHHVPLSILPRKILQPNCQGFFNGKKRLICPLSSNFYCYPEQIRKKITNPSNQLSSQGIGQFQRIFWFYQNTKLTVWNYNDSHNYKQVYRQRNLVFDSYIYGANIGILNNQEQNFSKPSITILAVAFSSAIKLFQIKQGLQINDLHILIRTQHSQSNQHIYFSPNNQIFFGPTMLTMMSFKAKPKKVTPLSFKHRITRFITPFPQQSTTQQIISIKNRVYCLMKKQVRKPWPIVGTLSKCVKRWITGKQPVNQSVRVINVYEITEGNQLNYLHRIEENVIAVKIRNNYAEMKGDNVSDGFQIKSMFIDNENNNLGIVLKCGYFALIKDTQNVLFWKQPQQIPKNPQFIGVEIPYNTKVSGNMEVEMHSHEVHSSKGYKNLTVLSDMIIYLDDNKFYFLKYLKPIGEIWEISKSQQYFSSRLPIMQPHQQWVVFQLDGFYLITKPQPRDVILAYSTYSQKEYRLAKKLQRLSYCYGYAEFCCYLIELLFCDNYCIRLDKQFDQLVKSEIQSDERRTYSQWISIEMDEGGNVSYQIEKCRDKIWDILIEYATKAVQPVEGQQVSTALWHTINFILYQIISPVLNWTPIYFMANKVKSQKVCNRLEKFNKILKQLERQWNYKVNMCESMISKEEINKYNNKSFNTTTSQLEITHHFNAPISTSSIQLSEMVQKAIPKLVIIIKIYQYLGDCQNTYNPLPSFQKIIHDNLARKVIRDAIMQQIITPTKQQLLVLIEQTIPELQIQSARTYIRWKEIMRRMNPDDVNLQKLAPIININHLQELRTYFINNQDKYLELLLQKIQSLKKQDYDLGCKNQLYNEGPEFEREQTKVISQNRYYIELDILSFKDQIKKFIQEVCRKAQNKHYRFYSQKNLPHYTDQDNKQSLIFERIIKLIAYQNDAYLKEQTDQILATFQLHQYSHLLKNIQSYKRTIQRKSLSTRDLGTQKGLGLTSMALRKFVEDKEKGAQLDKDDEWFLKKSLQKINKQQSDEEQQKTYKKTLNKQTRDSYIT